MRVVPGSAQHLPVVSHVLALIGHDLVQKHRWPWPETASLCMSGKSGRALNGELPSILRDVVKLVSHDGSMEKVPCGVTKACAFVTACNQRK